MAYPKVLKRNLTAIKDIIMSSIRSKTKLVIVKRTKFMALKQMLLELVHKLNIMKSKISKSRSSIDVIVLSTLLGWLCGNTWQYARIPYSSIYLVVKRIDFGATYLTLKLSVTTNNVGTLKGRSSKVIEVRMRVSRCMLHARHKMEKSLS